ncbi:hypothetical protein B0X60_02920 [Helicobacter pylori]|nr:hypothetical protein B0X60_02920 [Helicobacter pylori]
MKSIRLFGFFSCFLLSKIAYNQRKAKNRLMNYLATKKRLKRKYERKKTHDNSPKTNIRPFSVLCLDFQLSKCQTNIFSSF